MAANYNFEEQQIKITVYKSEPVIETMAFVPTLLLTNVCHILNKMDELYAVIENNDIDVTIISESWPPSDTPTSNVSWSSHYHVP